MLISFLIFLNLCGSLFILNFSYTFIATNSSIGYSLRLSSARGGSSGCSSRFYMLETLMDSYLLIIRLISSNYWLSPLPSGLSSSYLSFSGEGDRTTGFFCIFLARKTVLKLPFPSSLMIWYLFR